MECPRESGADAVLVAMSGEEIAAVGRAVEGDFAFGTATDGANFFRFSGAKALRFAFLTNWTGHGFPWVTQNYTSEEATGDW